VPLTPFQRRLLATLAESAPPGRYLAGGAALHFAPQSIRLSDDLDFFHDSEAQVAAAFAQDRTALEGAGYEVEIDFVLPGFVRTVVRSDGEATRVDWARDTTWRFMPLVREDVGGLLLHPVDLAINKVLALAGRDEPRDFVDILFAHETILRVAGLVWAAAGKDPGLSPLSLLELLRRHGRYRAEELARLRLTRPLDLDEARATWLAALEETDGFVRSRPPEEYGCLYYSHAEQRFVIPRGDVSLAEQAIVPHFAAPHGVLPRIPDESIDG